MQHEELRKKIEKIKIKIERTRSNLLGLRNQRDITIKQANRNYETQAQPFNESTMQLEKQLQALQAQCEVHPNFREDWCGMCPACNKYVPPPDDGLRAHM